MSIKTNTEYFTQLIASKPKDELLNHLNSAKQKMLSLELYEYIEDIGLLIELVETYHSNFKSMKLKNKIFDVVRKRDKQGCFILAKDKEHAAEIAIKLKHVKKIEGIKNTLDLTEGFLGETRYDQPTVRTLLSGNEYGQIMIPVKMMRGNDFINEILGKANSEPFLSKPSLYKLIK